MSDNPKHQFHTLDECPAQQDYLAYVPDYLARHCYLIAAPLIKGTPVRPTHSHAKKEN